ncbi:MAG: DNA polymerase III subunit gamma/tau [Magnetococcus sp. MYC-9]
MSSSYVVLARRWRPRSFAAMVGQGHVTQALGHALTTGRVPHAFLFSGIRGVGKTTLARLLAMCLDCEQGMTATPCGQCTSCQEIIAGNHPDVLEIDAASRTKVEQMREVLDMVGYSPAVSRYKVYILDEVHMLSSQSFNALLKTLEEPPHHVKFVFATTEPRKIPATILSRCQRYDLKRVPQDLLASHLQNILQTEQVPFEPAGVEAVVRSAEGSVRDALSLLDQVIAHGSGSVRYEAVKDLLGLTDPESILRLLDALLHGRGPEVLQGAVGLYNMGVEPESLIKELLEITHRATMQKVLRGAAHPSLSPPQTDLPGSLVAESSLEHLQMVYQVLLRGSQDLRLAEDALQALEMLLLRVAYLKPVPSLEKLLANLPNSEPLPPPGGRVDGPLPTLCVAAPVAPSPHRPSQPLTSWQQLVSCAAGADPSLAAKLEQLVTCLVYETDSQGVPCRIGLRLVSDVYGAPHHIQRLLVDFLATQGVSKLSVTVDPLSDAPRQETLAESASRRQRERQSRLMETMRNHPVIQKIINRFQGELIRVEPIGNSPT